MQTVTKRKLAVAVPALMAAGFSAWMGAPAAKGDFVVSIDPNPPTSPYSAPFGSDGTFVSGAVTYVDYVVSGYNDGVNSTGSSLLSVDAVITTPGAGTSGAIYLDIYKRTSSANRKVNVDDSQDANLGNGFAYAIDGTFGGIGTAPLAESPYTSGQDIAPGDTTDHSYDNGIQDKSTGATMDANYLNGTVHSWEIIGGYTIGNQPVPANSPSTALPFLNVVIPIGTTATVSGQLGGDNGPVENFTPIIINPVASVPTVSLTGSQAAGSTLIPPTPVTLQGGGDNYVAQVIPVTGPAQVFGSLEVNGFSPTTDEEVYGLAVTNLTLESLTSIAADLQGNSTNPANLQVETVASLSAGPLKSLLQTDGDNLVAIFPTGANPTQTSDFFNYNLNSYNGSVSITSITVVPEPTGIGALVLGGIGLLSRRKARRVA